MNYFALGLRSLFRDPLLFPGKVYRYFRPMRRYYRRRFGISLRQWTLYHHNNIVFQQCSWMGVRTQKNPCDCWIYQEIIWETKPEVIVEIGSASGGSTLYFAQLLDLIGSGTVVSIDISRETYDVSHPRVVAITGNSSAPAIVEQVADLCRGKRTLVIHDGDHEKKQVLRDLEAYAPFVGVGSYLIVEDGLIDLFRPNDGVGDFPAGPLKAIDQFLRTHGEFAIDRDRERYMITNSPSGFLKRVR